MEIHAAALTKTYGPLHALDALDLEIREVKVLALIGPSGGGKSTFLASWAGWRPRTGDP